jgi:hypothetical protein
MIPVILSGGPGPQWFVRWRLGSKNGGRREPYDARVWRVVLRESWGVTLRPTCHFVSSCARNRRQGG